MATVGTDRALIEAVVSEMTAGIACAVDFWMAQIEDAMEDSQLTTLGRLQAVQQILKTYRHTGAGLSVAGNGNAA